MGENNNQNNENNEELDFSIEVNENSDEEFSIEENDGTASSDAADEAGRDSTVDEKTPDMLMVEYMEQICAGVAAAGEDQLTTLTQKLSEAVQEIADTDAAIGTPAETVLLADLRIYDQKKDRFVKLSELTNPPEYVTVDSKPTYELVSKLLLDGHNFFLPKWKADGQMDMEDPIVIGGGFVGRDFYLQVDDKARREAHAALTEPLKKPSFFDRFVDLFKRIVGKRDAICEIWDRYEPFRKADHDRMKIIKKPEKMAKNIKEDLDELKAEAENSNLREEESRIRQEAIARQEALDRALDNASDNLLTGEGREALAKIHEKIIEHTRNLCQKGINRRTNWKVTADEKWGKLPNLRGGAGNDFPAYALFGMVAAFALLGAHKKDEALNQSVYRCLVEGNYEAIGGREGKYKEVIQGFEQLMDHADVNKTFSWADLDSSSNWDAADNALRIRLIRNYSMDEGLRRMEMELLSQPDPASPWSMELGRMLECAEAISIDKQGSYYANQRIGNVGFRMHLNTKGLCEKQRQIEKGIGCDPESKEYRDAEAAVKELRQASLKLDYEGFAKDELDNKIRIKYANHEYQQKENNVIRNPLADFAVKFEYECTHQVNPDYLEEGLKDMNADIHGDLLSNQLLLITAAYSLADEYQLSGDDIRQFVTGKKIREDEELTQKFTTAVQTVLNSVDKKKNKTVFGRGFEKMEADLYNQKDMNSAWAKVLSNALVGYSLEARGTTIMYAVVGFRNLTDTTMTSKRHKDNKFIRTVQDLASRAGWDGSPDRVVIKYRNETDREVKKKAYMDFLKRDLKTDLAESFINQFSGLKSPKNRDKFLKNNADGFMLVLKAADAFVENNIDKYLDDEQAFIKAGAGGAASEFNAMFKSNSKSGPAAGKQPAKQNPQNNAVKENKGLSKS